MKRREALAALGCMSLAGAGLFPACQENERSLSVKKEIKTENAPQALGPYSQAIEASGMVFASGQIAIDPATGKMDAALSVELQARQVLNNLKAVLDAAGSSMAKVVKCTVFLQDMNDYAAVNAVYAEFFPAPYPARAAVEVTRLPKDAKVEIEAIAIK